MLLVQENIHNAVTVYPNPSESGDFFVRLKGHNISSIELRDLAGRKVGGKLQMSPSGTDVIKIQSSTPLMKQPYILTLRIGDQTIIRMVIVN